MIPYGMSVAVWEEFRGKLSQEGSCGSKQPGKCHNRAVISSNVAQLFSRKHVRQTGVHNGRFVDRSNSSFYWLPDRKESCACL